MGGFCQIEIMNLNRLTNEVQLSRNIQRIIQEVEPMRVSFYCDALKGARLLLILVIMVTDLSSMSLRFCQQHQLFHII